MELKTGAIRLPHVHGRADWSGGKTLPVVGHLASAAKYESVGYSQHASSPTSQGGYHTLLLKTVDDVMMCAGMRHRKPCWRDTVLSFAP